MNSTRHSFTLIELLVVVVLISILVGITVPVYTRVMTGNAVSYGMRQVVSQLNMARVEACRSRRKVAVVFLIEKGDAMNVKLDEKDKGIYNRRAFRACYLKDDGETFDEWVFGTTWQTLPKGAFFVISAEGGFGSTGSVKDVEDDRSKDTSDYEDERLFSNLKVDLQHVIVFDETGRPETAARVVIAEGTLNANSPTKSDADPMDSSDASLLDPTDDNLGNTSLTVYLDNIHKPNMANWAKCKVNAYTGRVTTEMNE